MIGREREQQLLEKAYSSKESEFIVVYGRRRVGKTFLIREFFENKKCIFVRATGEQKAKLKKQLTRFVETLSKIFFDNVPLKISSWDEAFKLINQQISKHEKEKIVLFFDELPWLATKKSGLLQLIDYYWNHHWSAMKNVIFIACGSSASWLIKNIIYNRGGLHNRTTCEIQVKPFTLYETKKYLNSRKIKLNNSHILSIYMALGGIPYYLKYVEPGLTADQNIQHILFDENSPLKDEFQKLFQSLFENAEAYLEIINLVAQNKSGLTRAKIESKAKLSSMGGRLTERIRDLCQAGFLYEKTTWQKKIGECYTLIDEFVLFQLKWITHRNNKHFTKDYWINESSGQSYKSWSGYAFESVCLKHINQIIASLKIKSAIFIDSWRFAPRKNTEKGAQIDLLIDRKDNAITLCEIKYTNDPFAIDKQYATALQNKAAVFRSKTKTSKQLFLAMITANGLKPTMYSEELIDGVVVADDLFKE